MKDFKCPKCGIVKEAKDVCLCPQCGEPMNRVYSSFEVRMK